MATIFFNGIPFATVKKMMALQDRASEQMDLSIRKDREHKLYFIRVETNSVELVRQINQIYETR